MRSFMSPMLWFASVCDVVCCLFPVVFEIRPHVYLIIYYLTCLPCVLLGYYLNLISMCALSAISFSCCPADMAIQLYILTLLDCMQQNKLALKRNLVNKSSLFHLHAHLVLEQSSKEG